ncbi:tRNA pseudouridine(38-40) synthase TruA [Aquimarina sp. ERC-38]|uniref:tRNA pseudouridine(38-40) synthase TruA n=1 Tax=Aquimarina sp. ERC-38 TaxID=2949996 RepID=UPI002247F787|nr:tRNA pseudouridine(38-40) synthase TruA [Aquimarina sp. ERC-38]UZO79244.1 tRNA pseudouridine(38-40) synthase TruA [Aquimarina sp. ERC-38]
MRYFIDISFKGSSYHGWQKQPNANTVQETIEEKLSILFHRKVDIIGAGRTDSGVHARQLIAHLDLDESEDLTNILYRLNSFLPQNISINSIVPVIYEAHARFSALSRSYIYKVHTQKNPFFNDFSYLVTHPLDIAMMNKAAGMLLDYKNFKCFSKGKTDVKTYFCDIKEAGWRMEGNQLQFYIKADRFLRNMVRAIVGTLLEIGSGKLPITELPVIIESQNRSKAGFSVPAHGLYLQEVTYPQSIYL